MTSCLSKILFKYDLELMNADLDWESASRCYVMWWKPPVYVMFKERDIILNDSQAPPPLGGLDESETQGRASGTVLIT